ncbi:M17 family metallopeptidase [Nannocystaceae bacterium ST9]
MRVTTSDRPPTELAADALIVVFRAPARGRPRPPLSEHLRGDAGRLIARKPDSITWLETHELATPRVLLFCLGAEPAPWNPQLEYLGGHAGSLGRETWALRVRRALRNAGAQIERACTGLGLRHVVLAAWPDDCDPGLVIEGMLLRAHDPRAWDGERHEEATSLRRVTACLPSREHARIRELLMITEATNFARLLGDLPSNHSLPSRIVARVRERFASLPVEVRTISAVEARAMGMGLFTAVDAGAGERGCILVLELGGRTKTKRKAGRRKSDDDDIDEPPLLALLGKGLIHDTGGYNIKTSHALHELTHDKCGATAVIGAMLAIAQLDLGIRVMGICPLTENCIDAHAYKPGDILRAYDGTTVYVENTDAEGRLVLADALAWLGQFDPELAIDLATLTASVHTTLGEPFAALYCNEDRARDLLMEAGRVSGDLLWPMPIHEVHERDLGHHKADLRNIGAHAGNPSAAAAFLRHFVNFPWAHVDFAGKAHAEYGREMYGPGATGFGVRLLVELARRFAASMRAAESTP